MKGRARDASSGFALAESIAVLALSALVLLTLLIATNLVSRNSAAAARHAEALEMLATGLAAARRDLESALQVPSAVEENAPIVFSGDVDALGLAVTSDRSGRGGESLLWFETRYEDGEGALIRSSAPLLPGTGGFAEVPFGDSALLARGPWEYRFSYAKADDKKLRWADTWKSAAELPAAIRLAVLDAEERPVVPPLVVNVRIDTIGCAGQSQEACRGGESAAAEGGQQEEENAPDGR